MIKTVRQATVYEGCAAGGPRTVYGGSTSVYGGCSRRCTEVQLSVVVQLRATRPGGLSDSVTHARPVLADWSSHGPLQPSDSPGPRGQYVPTVGY